MGAGAGASCGDTVGVGTAGATRGRRADETRKPEKLGRRDQWLSPSVSLTGLGVGSPFLTSALTRKIVPRPTRPATSSETARHLAGRSRTDDKSLSPLICQLSPKKLQQFSKTVKRPP